jgi:hypothetical protein
LIRVENQDIQKKKLKRVKKVLPLCQITIQINQDKFLVVTDHLVGNINHLINWQANEE